MRVSRSILGAFAALTLLGGPALAHNHNGHGEGHDTHAGHSAISQQRAEEIATQQGVARVREIELRRGVWKVEGFTAQGRAIEVEIDAHSGAVVKRELY